MLLSIGMIVKNEEQRLEKCLTALVPLLEKIDSELIIADTGSMDGTVEIAKKFTDNVFHFEWVKDFAAARNSTLRRAKGEWFMYVDADEVFKDCDDIISFFASGEYRKYNSASYVQRNYVRVPDTTTNEITYTNLNVLRIVKLTPESGFVGVIHEMIQPAYSPTKILGSVADHYGYLDIDPKINEEKIRRNSELLLKKLEKREGDLKILYSQLFDCFYYIDKEAALDYLQKGIDEGYKENSVLTPTLIAKKINYYFTENEHEKVLDECEKFCALNNTMHPAVMYCDADVAVFKAMSLKALGRYAEAIDAFRSFFDIFNKMQSGRIGDTDAVTYDIKTATVRNFPILLKEMIQSCILTDKFNIAEEYLTTLPVHKYSENRRAVALLIGEEIKVLEHFGFRGLAKYHKQLDSFGQELLVDDLRMRAALGDGAEEILPALYEMTKDEVYPALLRIYRIDDKEEAASAARDFAGKYPPEENYDLLCRFVKKDLDVSAIINESVNMPLYAGKFFTEHDGLFLIFDDYDFSAVTTDDGARDLCSFFINIMNIAAIRKRPLTPVFEIYGKIADGCRITMLSPETKASFIIGEMNRAHSTHSYKLCFEKLKEAVTACPKLKEAVLAYHDELMAEYEEYVKDQKNSEMQRLAAAVKSNIRALISGGKPDEARKTLAEYEKLNPDDPEIPDIKARING